jgi:hypothetical protein
MANKTQTFPEALLLWVTAELELISNENLIEMYVKIREEVERRKIAL